MAVTLPVLRAEHNAVDMHWDDQRGRLSFRSLIDGDATATSGLTFGTATLQAGGFLAAHRHVQAEIYYILNGRGTLTIDGNKYEVSAGSGIFIPGNAEHATANTGSEPLKFLYAFAADRFSEIVYVFS
jgi:mannose-6-phosphate isomerase-like protein (cupin superfamily)